VERGRLPGLCAVEPKRGGGVVDGEAPLRYFGRVGGNGLVARVDALGGLFPLGVYYYRRVDLRGGCLLQRAGGLECRLSHGLATPGEVRWLAGNAETRVVVRGSLPCCRRKISAVSIQVGEMGRTIGKRSRLPQPQ
jgi:hypothetical protein